MKSPKVIYKDFKKEKDKVYKEIVGQFLPDDNIIEIDSNLPEKTSGTRQQTLNHEKMHYWFYTHNVFFKKPIDEENCAELMSIIITQDKYLSLGERLLKKKILGQKKNKFQAVLDFLEIKL